MNIKSEINTAVEVFLGEKLVESRPVSGGCIADTRLIRTEYGQRYFLKTHAGYPGMFLKEAHGLQELAKPACIRVPKVLLADEAFLLLEYIEQGGKGTQFFESFGESFAEMHRYTNERFGFFEDNYIGASPQYNLARDAEQTDWATFYWEKRLLPQLKLAAENGYANEELIGGMNKLELRIPEIINGSEEQPNLLHGDLWGGNYLCDAEGKAVLIDPAVYYGHREADLAMTKMFGGFSEAFYDSYQQTYPLKSGWEYRENLYLLYHYLNHVNLFGSSYLGTALRLIHFYL